MDNLEGGIADPPNGAEGCLGVRQKESVSGMKIGNCETTMSGPNASTSEERKVANTLVEKEPAQGEDQSYEDGNTKESLVDFPSLDQVVLLKNSNEDVENDNDWESLENVKPFIGFKDDDEGQLTRKIIEDKSELLYQHITQLKTFKGVINVVGEITGSNKGGSVPIPSSLLEATSTPCMLKIKVLRGPDADQVESLQEMVDWLCKPFNAGWKRELLYKSIFDSQADTVQYISPDQTVIKNQDELMDYLENVYGLSESGLNKKNFSFYRSPLMNLGNNDGELLYLLDTEGGKSLFSLKNLSTNPENDLRLKRATVVRKKEGGSNAPAPIPIVPKLKQNTGTRTLLPSNNMVEQKQVMSFSVENNNATSREVKKKVKKHTVVRNTGRALRTRRAGTGGTKYFGLADNGNHIQAHLDRAPVTYLGHQSDVLPCCMTCPGMEGAIPDLNCKKCLCLYHLECLGSLVSHVNLLDFVCPNCEPKSEICKQQRDLVGYADLPLASYDGHKTLATFDTSILPQGILKENEKSALPSRMPISARSRKDKAKAHNDSDSASTQLGLPKQCANSNKKNIVRSFRARGQGMQNAGPVLRSHLNLRQTQAVQLSCRKIPVPELHKFVPAPPTELNRPKIQRRMVAIKPMMKTSPVPFQPAPAVPKRNDNPNLDEETSGSNYLKPYPTRKFRRLPQSIIAIGNKKFIAIPYGSRDDVFPTEELGVEKENTEESNQNRDEPSVKECANAVPGFHNDKVILAKIFRYLSIRDLLAASHVNQTWNTIACNKDSWKFVRMKNTQVFDFGSFAEFLKKYETEVIDLRKITGNSDWEVLGESLGKVTGLKEILIDSRNATGNCLISLRAKCPHVKIIIA